MAQGLITYPGVLKAKSAAYTQRRGVRPDALKIELVPQAGGVANFGTATFSYDGDSVSLPNCTVDTSRISYATNGFLASVVLLDRRELWNFANPISGHYNEIDQTGERITATQKNLRQLVDLLMLQLGEVTYLGPLISTSVFPEVDWHCERPVVVLQQLLEEWGYELVLGFNFESVQIGPRGVGFTLPANTDEIMQASDTYDPPLRPQIIRTCFGPSEAQARFLLEAVCLDTDGTFKPSGSVSYAPGSGWGSHDPYHMTEFQRAASFEEAKLARYSLYRIYRIKAFADGTLNLPDGSGTLNNIGQILPIDPRRLEEETVGGRRVRGPAKLYGAILAAIETKAQPLTEDTTAIDDELSLDFQIDLARGLVIFQKPVFKLVGGVLNPADLYLETAFRIRDSVTHQFYEYQYDQVYDFNGYGMYTIPLQTHHAVSIVQYGASHSITGVNTNQLQLNGLAGLVAIAIEGRFHAAAGQVIWYNQPKFGIRLDGLISEVTHIVSDGDNNQPGAYTIGVRNMEFDRSLMSGVERRLILDNVNRMTTQRDRQALAGRIDKGNA